MEPSSNLVGEKNNQTKLTRNILLLFGEIFLLLLLLGAGLIALNYFNILKLNQMFPALSFLPQKTSIQKTPVSKATSKATTGYRPTFIAPKEIKDIFITISKDTIQEKNAVEAIGNNVIIENSGDNKITNNSDGGYSLVWTGLLNNQIFSVTSLVKNYSKTSYDYTTRVIATVKNVPKTLTKEQANDFAGQYFINKQFSDWKCEVSSAQSTCISENSLENQKLTYRVNAKSDIPNKIFIKLCSAIKQSPNYNKANYCLF